MCWLDVRYWKTVFCRLQVSAEPILKYFC
jgi:hypothetical protein